MLRRGLRTMVVVGLVAAAFVQPSTPASGAPASRLTVTFDPQPTDGGIVALPLTAPAAVPGQHHRLVARSDDFPDATSATFDTYAEATRCRNATGSSCVVDIDSPQVMHVTVSAPTTSGALGLNLGPIPTGTGCATETEVEHHAPGLVLQGEAGIGVDKLAVMTIAKEVVQARSDNGASFYSVCFSKDGVHFSLLPDCPPAKKRTVACVVSKTKTGAGDVQITIFVPKGDPTWW